MPGTGTAIDTAAYLDRIGHRGDTAPTLQTLREIHLAHLYAVPFENIDIHLGRPIVLDEVSLFDKMVRRRRGGFCYELNGLFAALLRELGFAVTLVGAEFPREPGEPSPDLDHLTLLVQTTDRDTPVLADVAAGRGSFAVPLRTDTEEEQAQPEAGASFRLLPEGDATRLWRRAPDDEWEREYLFTRIPRQLDDFNEGCRFHQTSPASHFTQQRMSTLLTPEGRITLAGQRLITTRNGAREERGLGDESQVEDALRTHFSIDLNLYPDI
jgi:N-hydroxyarylamine O-acetyltransferase